MNLLYIPIFGGTSLLKHKKYQLISINSLSLVFFRCRYPIISNPHTEACMLLGLSGHPGREEISKARRQMALMWHPVSWLKTGPEKESGHVSIFRGPPCVRTTRRYHG